MIPSVASNTHHTLTAASADSRAGGGRRWDSGLEGAPELWACEMVRASPAPPRASAHSRARIQTHTHTHTHTHVLCNHVWAKQGCRNGDPGSQEQVGPPLAGGQCGGAKLCRRKPPHRLSESEKFCRRTRSLGTAPPCRPHPPPPRCLPQTVCERSPPAPRSLPPRGARAVWPEGAAGWSGG